MYNVMINWVSKIKEFADEHKTAFDLSVGSGIGFFPSIVKYWEHFTTEENQFHFWDGVVNTAGNTITGALILWVIHTFILKKNKKDGNNSTKI